MLFTSFEFVILFIITFLLFYSVKKQLYQSIVLLLSSLVFYGWNSPILLLLLISSILINVIASYWVYKLEGHFRKIIAIIGVVVNLLILSFFKYGALLGETFFSINSSINQFLLGIPLPIGISFFTFEGISLVVDSFKSNDNRRIADKKLFNKHFLNVSLFISFFPHLIAGPILKAHEFIPQIKKKQLKEINVDFCFKNLITGYFLKMVVADNLKDQTFWMEYPYFEAFSGMDLIGLLFAYSIQIFADFAGYSLIAIGLAGMFGYRFNDNFLFPYISTSFSEFWQRWHISLSSFLKEYLYIPLGGNKNGEFKTYRNLFIVMVLGGLWHGAAWSYAVWGAYHGSILVIERYLTKHYTYTTNVFFRFLKGMLVFSIVSVGWLFFKLPVFSQAILYIKLIFYSSFYSNEKEKLLLILLYSSPVLFYHFLYLVKSRLNYNFYWSFSSVFYAIMLFFIILNSGSAGNFIYFQF